MRDISLSLESAISVIPGWMGDFLCRIDNAVAIDGVLVSQEGIEPPTLALGEPCSIR